MTQEETDSKQQDTKMQKLLERVSELENNWKRALADYQNLQKRVAEEKQQIVSYANSTLILKLLFVLDNLEMVEQHSNDQGLSLSVKTFQTVLEEEGVEEIEIDGKEFNPETMDAIEKVPGEENKVVEVLQKGYMLKQKILRPARVKVGNGSDESDNEFSDSKGQQS